MLQLTRALLKLISSLPVGLLVATNANAASVTYDNGVPLQAFYTSGNSSPRQLSGTGSRTFTLPQFDPSLGSLNQVTVVLSGNAEGQYSYTYRAYGTTNNPSFSLGGYSVLRGPTTLGLPFGLGEYRVNITAFTGSDTLTANRFPRMQQSNESVFDASSPFLSNFIGSNTMTFLLEDSFVYVKEVPYVTDLNIMYSYKVAAAARITYDYTPAAVPTPALLPGLIGLGYAAYHKHKSRSSKLRIVN